MESEQKKNVINMYGEQINIIYKMEMVCECKTHICNSIFCLYKNDVQRPLAMERGNRERRGGIVCWIAAAM